MAYENDMVSENCNNCNRELKIPKGVYETIQSVVMQDVRAADGTTWKEYRFPNRHAEPFRSLLQQPSGDFFISPLTGSFFCDQHCLTMYTED
jgi:hypothetical protein